MKVNSSSVAPGKHQQILTGQVIKKAMQKTITVAVVRKFRHAIYQKVIMKTKKYLVDDPLNQAQENDQVEIIRVRRLSLRKHFRLHKILTSKKNSKNSTTTK